MIHLLLLTTLINQDLSQNKRIVSVYTNDVGNTAYQKQLEILSADHAGIHERDIVIEKHIRNADNNALFNHAKINNDFTIILTGKDGGEKFRSVKPVSLKKLYSIIDVMPMRKEEMKHQ